MKRPGQTQPAKSHMPGNKPAEPKTPWQAAYEARPQYYQDVDVTGFFGHDGAPLPKIRFVVNSKWDDIAAVNAAHAFVAARVAAAGLTGDAAQRASNDADQLVDVKTVEALYRACLSPDDNCPCFGTPEWMLKNLDSDQIGCLLRTYVQVRRARGPIPERIDHEFIEALRDSCVSHRDTNIPELSVAMLDPTDAASAFVLMATMWHDEREELLRYIGAAGANAFIDDTNHAIVGNQIASAIGAVAVRTGLDPESIGRRAVEIAQGMSEPTASDIIDALSEIQPEHAGT